MNYLEIAKMLRDIGIGVMENYPKLKEHMNEYTIEKNLNKFYDMSLQAAAQIALEENDSPEELKSDTTVCGGFRSVLLCLIQENWTGNEIKLLSLLMIDKFAPEFNGIKKSLEVNEYVFPDSIYCKVLEE